MQSQSVPGTFTGALPGPLTPHSTVPFTGPIPRGMPASRPLVSNNGVIPDNQKHLMDLTKLEYLKQVRKL